VSEIRIALTVSDEAAIRALGIAVPAPLSVTALIDTGASHTVLQQRLASRLGLQPVGRSAFQTPTQASASFPRYDVRLHFPHDIEKETTVVGMPLQGQHIQCLIGRDVLADAVLVYLGESNLFSLSF
jgi:predicted aspartyl protease